MTQTSESLTQPPGPPEPRDFAAEPSDVQLFAAAQAGDYAAFEAIVSRYHERMYRLVLGMVKNASDAEEVVQETFLNVFRSLGSFKSASAPASWMYRIAVNAALMRLRGRRRKPLLSLDTPGAASQLDATRAPAFWPAGNWGRAPDEQLLSQELGHRIEESINQLPEKYRLVLLLRDVEGHSNEEIAHTLGLTVPTVKSRLHRARLVVRQALEVYFHRK